MLGPTLPDLSQFDREQLRALLLAEHHERIATQQQLQHRDREIETLKLLLSQLRRMQFGRKSEKLGRQIEQLELRLEDLQQARAAAQTTPAAESPCPEIPPSTSKATRCGGRCRNTCRGKSRRMYRNRPHVQTAEERYAS